MRSRIESFRRIAALLLSVLTVCLGRECPICGRKDEYPGNVDKYIVARYVGSYTCGQLFYRGLDDKIPGFMCGPLQDYAYEPCQCGPSNPHPDDYQPASADDCWIPAGLDLPANSVFRNCNVETTDPPSKAPNTPPPTPELTGFDGLPLRKDKPLLAKAAFKLSRGGGSGNVGTSINGNGNRMLQRSEPEEI
jgi:hypothetical protein